MNREDAKAWLAKETASDSETPLSSGDLDTLLDEAAGGGDSFTLRQLHAAASVGWGWRAAATAEFHTAGEQLIHEHAVERQKHYARRSVSGGAVYRTPDPASVKALL